MAHQAPDTELAQPTSTGGERKRKITEAFVALAIGRSGAQDAAHTALEMARSDASAERTGAQVQQKWTDAPSSKLWIVAAPETTFGQFSEATLVSKVRRRQRAFGGAWENVMHLAVLVRDGVQRPRDGEPGDHLKRPGDPRRGPSRRRPRQEAQRPRKPETGTQGPRLPSRPRPNQRPSNGSTSRSSVTRPLGNRVKVKRKPHLAADRPATSARAPGPRSSTENAPQCSDAAHSGGPMKSGDKDTRNLV